MNAFVSNVYHLVRLCKASSSGDNNFVWSNDSNCASILSRPSKWKRWSFIILSLSCAAIRAKFWINRRSTLHKLRNDINSVLFVRCFSSRMVLASRQIWQVFSGLLRDRGSPFYRIRKSISSASTIRWNQMISQARNGYGRGDPRLTWRIWRYLPDIQEQIFTWVPMESHTLRSGTCLVLSLNQAALNISIQSMMQFNNLNWHQVSRIFEHRQVSRFILPSKGLYRHVWR